MRDFIDFKFAKIMRLRARFFKQALAFKSMAGLIFIFLVQLFCVADLASLVHARPKLDHTKSVVY